MKKFVVPVILFLLSTAAFSQKKVKFGVFVDPQISWLSPESRTSSSNGVNWGIDGGLTIDHYFAKNYALATGISIGTQGGKIKYDSSKTVSSFSDKITLPPNTTLTYKLQYLTIPLGLKLKSNQIGYTTFFVNVGFTGQINLKAKGESDNTTGENLKDDSMKDDINFFNLGYHFGGGVEYALGEDTAVSLSLIYHNGFIDITKTSPQINSRVISFRLGLMF